tara:strand:- start:80 stop:853 length:774 start_codon:yes stop_codon:yes gene_type:complete
MAQIKARKNGAWVSVPNGTTIKAEKNGSLVNPTKIQARKNGAWYTVWNKSDPLTLAFDCNVSEGWRENSWRGNDDIYIGAWQSGAPYGTLGTFYGDNLSALEFSGNSTTGGHTSTTLAEALAVRPNVTSATLYLYRRTAGFGTIPSMTNTLKVGQMNKANGTTLNYDAADFVQTTNMQTIPASDLIGWGTNDAETFTLPSSGLTDFITHVSTKQMWLSEKTTGWVAYGGSATYNKLYSIIDGAGDTYNPVLTVTMDY